MEDGPLKRCYLITTAHGVTTQKISARDITAVKTSKPAARSCFEEAAALHLVLITTSLPDILSEVFRGFSQTPQS